ncbi:hypothetical protein [Devosia submarina]|uniref:hypothetical protein n=1 Tax=Devosia submarina TaxID=1173082 RepID=UPI001FEBAE26|nr:hypothetical protein [Devosia submarina]
MAGSYQLTGNWFIAGFGTPEIGSGEGRSWIAMMDRSGVVKNDIFAKAEPEIVDLIVKRGLQNLTLMLSGGSQNSDFINAHGKSHLAASLYSYTILRTLPIIHDNYSLW